MTIENIQSCSKNLSFSKDSQLDTAVKDPSIADQYWGMIHAPDSKFSTTYGETPVNRAYK
jgi:hypothetical protein